MILIYFYFYFHIRSIYVCVCIFVFAKGQRPNVKGVQRVASTGVCSCVCDDDVPQLAVRKNKEKTMYIFVVMDLKDIIIVIL